MYNVIFKHIKTLHEQTVRDSEQLNISNINVLTILLFMTVSKLLSLKNHLNA